MPSPKASEAGSALASARRTIATEIAGLEAVSAALGNEIDEAVALLAACQGKVVVTGMGKSGHICRKIVADHDGWVAVDSVPGRTVFRVSLPVATERTEIS